MKGYWNSPTVRRLLSKRGRTGFFCLLAGAGVLWWMLVPKEPSYQGKTLTEWQEAMVTKFESNINSYRALHENAEEFEVPMQSMGTNTLPFLIQQLQVHDSRFKIWLIEQCQRNEWSRNILRSEDYYYQAATLSLVTLKEKADPIVLDLVKLAESGDEETKAKVITTCMLMGVSSDDFLSLLVRNLRAGTEREKEHAAYCLYELGPKAKSALPELQKLSNSGGRSAKEADKLKSVIYRLSLE